MSLLGLLSAASACFAQSQGHDQGPTFDGAAYAPGQSSALQPPPLAGAIGPPITFDTHDEYLRAHSTQRRALDPEEIARLRDRSYIAAHPYYTNPFIKQQYCKLRNDAKKSKEYIDSLYIDTDFLLDPGERFETFMGEAIDISSKHPYFREKYFNNRALYRYIKEFTIIRTIEHGGANLTGKPGTYETIYEIKSHTSGETLLVSMDVLRFFFHPGPLHPKLIYSNSEQIRLTLEIEARLRKKYLDDNGIDSFIASTISYTAKWDCDEAVTKK